MTNAAERDDKSDAVLAASFAPVMRFLATGVVNTLLSIAVYQAALFAIGHVVAYGIAYATGILFSYVAYARHVFDVPLSTKRFMVFALFYVASGGLGTLVNASLIEHFSWHARLAIFATVIIMLPLNYFGSKWCLRGTTGHNP